MFVFFSTQHSFSCLWWNTSSFLFLLWNYFSSIVCSNDASGITLVYLVSKKIPLVFSAVVILNATLVKDLIGIATIYWIILIFKTMAKTFWILFVTSYKNIKARVTATFIFKSNLSMFRIVILITKIHPKESLQGQEYFKTLTLWKIYTLIVETIE